MLLHEDRLFPADPDTRAIARRLFAEITDLPLICPHGHTDPAWFADNDQFPDPAQLLIVPDHYVLRMLVSRGVDYKALGIAGQDGRQGETDGRKIWRLFAEHYHLFRSTPTRLWLDHTLQELFGIEVPLSAETADAHYDQISECLTQDAFRPRALFDRFRIEVITTTESPIDDLRHHEAIRDSGWDGRVITAYRPDPVVDPDFEGFTDNLRKFGELTDEDTGTWQGYLAAHRKRRTFFASMGATSTDHGHPTARTADIGDAAAQLIFNRVTHEVASPEDKELFRAQMLTEMAAMSCDDGLVMQIHAGSHRNHNKQVFDLYGRDKGFDIPTQTNYVSALKPLLDRFGMDPRLSIILFTLDETAYSRELGPLAGAYPCLKLGPAWWFFDSADGMLRYREQVTETAGYYNTAGFNDDTRAFPSIPARHDVARRIDCAFLARQVAEHRIGEDEAREVAVDLAYGLAKKSYNL
jgi:glucuronate isomerase